MFSNLHVCWKTSRPAARASKTAVSIGSVAVAALLGVTLTASLAGAQSAGYYDSVDTSSASALRSTLHQVIDDHTRRPYTSSSPDVWDMVNAADEDPNDTGRIIDLYKNESMAKIPGGSGPYNREHVWPKSYGFPDDGSSNYAYTDGHHLFACDTQYNSARSNKPFRNCTSGCTEYGTDFSDGRGGGGGGNSNYTSGSFSSGAWEAWDGRKGDVARAIFYMDLRYEGGTHGVTGVSEPDLRLTDNESLIDNSNTGNNESVAYMGMLSVLLQWHADDPVDTRELFRNGIIEGFQGNRNPFIDHPEWVSCIYQGTNCGAGGGGGGGGGGGANELSNGVAKTGISGGQGSEIFYTLSVPAGASDLQFQLSGGSGDADLYVRRGSQPTTSTYDCRPWRSGNNETCSFSSPANDTYHVMIRGYSAYSGTSLVATFTESGGGGSCTPATLTRSSLSGSTGTELRYTLSVPSCATSLSVEINGGSGDGDLYVRQGSAPTTSTYDCRPWLNGNNETCSFNNPQSGTWHIMVRGYSSFSGLNLNATAQ